MKLFIWDLHGTLEQGNERAVVVMSNKILKDFGYSERFSDQDGNDLYGKRWYEYFEYLLPNVPHERHVELQAASFDYSNTVEGARLIAQYISPSKHALEILEEIARHHTQIVISNTVPESLPVYLGTLQMLEYFPEGRAFAVNQHTKEAKRTKADVARAYLAEYPADEIIVIGDSDGDMQLAHEIGAKSYLYVHNGMKFRSNRGHVKINDLAQLRQEI